MNLKNLSSFFIVSISIVITLIYGKTLLIPFVFAMLLWCLIRELKLVLDKVAFIKNRFPSWIKSIIASVFFLSLLGLFSQIILSSINSLSQSMDVYESNVTKVINIINQSFNIDLVSIIKDHATDFDIGSILSAVFNSLTDLLGNAFIIIFYALFIFLEETNFQKKLQLIFSSKEQYERVIDILDEIELSVTSYIGLKTLVSFITGFISYIILLIIGVDSPAFWAFLIFLLNFIPTVGSLAGTLFPAIFSLFQFGTLMPFLMVLIFVGLTQVVVGNILEPKLMGNSLNISSLIAIISLAFWGSIWGVTGMIISIPITVIMVIVFSQFEKTRPVAIMLSEKGIIK